MPVAEKKGNPAGTSLRIFLANAGHGGIRGVAYLAGTLVLIPLLMNSLGKEQFAILALATPFLRYGFNGAFDFGLATGLVRHTSRSFAAGKSDGVNRYVSSALALYLFFGATLICLYYLLAPSLLPLVVRANTEFYGSARMVLERAAWIYLLFSLSNPFFATLMGVQKVETTHWVGTASLLIELVGVLLLIHLGITLSRVMWVYGANAAFSLVFSAFLAKRYFSALRLGWRFVSWSGIKDILSYGVQYSPTTMAAMLGPVLDKLILARFVGLSTVALYEGAARLAELSRRVTQLFLLPLLPIAGARQETHTETERHTFYVRMFSANLLMSCALYLIPASLAFGIFRLWLGPESRLGAVAFVVLSLTVFCQAIVIPIGTIFAGTGRLWPLMTTALVGLLVNVIVSPTLAFYSGFTGLLAGTAIAYGVVSLVFLLWSFRISEFKIPAGQLFRLSGPAALAALLPGIALTRALHLGGQPLGWLKLFLVGTIASAVFAVVALAQTDVRRMALRVLDQVRQKVSFAWAR